MTRDSSDQQFLSHDLSENVVANLLDKEARSQQERILGQTKAVVTSEKLLRQRRSFKERSCHDTVLYVVTPKEHNSSHNR